MEPPAQDSKLSEKTAQINRRQEELERLPKEALVKMLLRTEGEWSKSTLKFPAPTTSRSFNLEQPWAANEFRVLPAGSASYGSRGARAAWRIVLVGIDVSHPSIGIEVRGEVVIGRASGDTRPDLDLSPFSADQHGVSRKHALLRPDDKSLWLADLGSTNGTFNNSARLTPYQPQALEDKDIVAFGRLQFLVRLMHSNC